MILHWSPKSPFVRKVVIVAEECGLSDRIERRRSVAVFDAAPNPAILADNPLGKIPVLITDDGLKLVDSRVICDYLIDLSEVALFCVKAKNHFRAAFGPLCGAMVTIDAPGPAPADLRRLTYRHVPAEYLTPRRTA